MKKTARHGPLKAALKIMVYLSEHRFGATIHDLMQETGRGRRNIYRYLAALNEAGIEIQNCSPRGAGIIARFRIVDRPRWSRMLGIL